MRTFKRTYSCTSKRDSRNSMDASTTNAFLTLETSRKPCLSKKITARVPMLTSPRLVLPSQRPWVLSPLLASRTRTWRLSKNDWTRLRSHLTATRSPVRRPSPTKPASIRQISSLTSAVIAAATTNWAKRRSWESWCSKRLRQRLTASKPSSIISQGLKQIP